MRKGGRTYEEGKNALNRNWNAKRRWENARKFFCVHCTKERKLRLNVK